MKILLINKYKHSLQQTHLKSENKNKIGTKNSQKIRNFECSYII